MFVRILRILFASVALLLVAADADARPWLRGRQQTCSSGSCSVTSSQSAASSYSCVDGKCTITRTSSSETTTTFTNAGDALDEVNAKRAARGLRPYLRDAGLTAAAQACAEHRAARGIRDHTPNDFAFLPPGCSASAAGCGGLDVSWGWASCCTYDSYTYAGAASVVVGGRRYNHIFVR